MSSTASRQPDALFSWMEGLSDPTRLRLLRLLERHELGVAELCHVLQMPQSTVSRHLKVLGDQGFVGSRAQGTQRLYRMELDTSGGLRRLWTLAKEQTEGWATVQQDQLRLTQHLSARQPAAQAFFAGAAGTWDRLRSELYGDAFTQDALLALVPPDWTVADLGCGTGQVAALLAPHVRQVVGVDQSAAMLKAAARRTAAHDNVDLRRGSLEALPLDAASIDAALVLLALTYVPDVTGALREVARVVRPGGRIIVVDLLRHDREDFRREMGQQSLGFETAALEDLITEAGFGAVRCRPLPLDTKARGPALVLASATRNDGSPNGRSH
jgi:ubiquinone/menaquinone biosynthesis C-methylase UbiE/DNA-binding MarR family transcriptional regulator